MSDRSIDIYMAAAQALGMMQPNQRRLFKTLGWAVGDKRRKHIITVTTLALLIVAVAAAIITRTDPTTFWMAFLAGAGVVILFVLVAFRLL